MKRRFFLGLFFFVWLVALGALLLATEKPTGSITGRVTSREGLPLAGARVLFVGPSRRTVLTGKDGTYRADRLQIGRYMVQARARGYDGQWVSPSVSLREGQVLPNVSFSLLPREPVFYFANYQRVTTPDEPLRIGLRGTLIDQLDLKVYRVDLGRYLKAKKSLDGLDHLLPAQFAQLPGVFTPVATWSQIVRPEEADEDDWFFKGIVPPVQENGVYLLSVTGSRQTRQGATLVKTDSYWFNRTDLAFVSKRASDRLLLYAVDLVTKQPVDGANFSVYGEKGILRSGKTGANGLSMFPLKAGNRVTVLGWRERSFATVASTHYSYERAHKILTYTERPVYRPAQTVHFRGLASRLTPKGNRVPRNARVRVRIKDPSDDLLYDRTLAADAFGAFFDQLTLAKEAPLGDYSIEASIGEDSEYAQFKVAEYRKPEFRIEVSPERGRVINGEPVKASVAATYYFGAPVAGSKVNYAVYSTPVYAQGEDPFYLGFDGSDFEGYGDLVTQGEAVTDADGKVRIEFPSERIEGEPQEQTFDQRYTIEVEGIDSSRRSVRGKGTVLVTRGDWKLDASVEDFIQQPGKPVRVHLSASDYADRPVSPEVSLTVSEQHETRKGDEIATTYRTVMVKKLRLSQGQGVAELSLAKEGQYHLAVTAVDQTGHSITQQVWFWVASNEFGSANRYGSMVLAFDKKVYRPGDTARVILSAPVGNVPVLLTRESATIEEARVIGLTSPSRLLEIPITRDFEPNVFLSAVLVNGKEFHSVEKSLNVTPAEQFLDLSIEPDREQYKPGEQATITVRAKDATGRPVSAELSLGVVDEAIYAVEPDHTPDLKRFFLGPRYSQVTTNHSFSEDYSGGVSKDRFEPDVREKFEDTAAWFPALRTDRNGYARVSFRLPDNLTTWVVTARGNTLRSQFGGAAKSFLATKDLLVRLIAPRFLIQGDRVSIGGIAHNRTDRPQKLEMSVKVQGLSLRERTPSIQVVGPHDSKRAEWSADASTVGQAAITVFGRGKTDGDAMKLSIPVLPHGIEQFQSWAGSLASRSVIPVEVPSAAIPETVRLHLELNPTPLQGILQAIQTLRVYPYGCTEQTVSRFFPEVLTYQVVRTLPGKPINHPDWFAHLPEQLDQGLKRVYALQQSDGGWGWWEHGESEPELTSYVLQGLEAAERAGFKVNLQVVRRGIRYLRAYAKKIGPDTIRRYSIEQGTGPDSALMALYALSLYQATEPASLETLYGMHERLSNYGRALLVLTLANSGQLERAEEVLSGLDRTAIRSPGLVHWASGAVRYSWFDSDVEATARVLQAMIRLRPLDPNVPQIVRWLMGQKRGAAWDSTKETATVILALDRYLFGTLPKASESRVSVRMDGNAIADFRITPQTFWTGTFALDRPLPPGLHRLEIAQSNEMSLPYSMQLSYFERGENLPARNYPGLSVSRRYFILPRQNYLEHRELDFREAKTFGLSGMRPMGRTVGSGELVLVRIRLTNSDRLRYLIVEDPLPAGAEVMEDLREDWGYWWNHREVRDEKVALFVSWLEPGTHDLFYVLRPEIPGDFQALPTQVYPMYLPDVRAWSAEDRFEIRP